MPGGRSVTMGAGQSATRNANVNQLQYGNKLQGLVPMATGYYKASYTGNNYRSRADGNDRNVVFYINQLSTIGPRSTMFAPNADGVKKKVIRDECGCLPGTGWCSKKSPPGCYPGCTTTKNECVGNDRCGCPPGQGWCSKKSPPRCSSSCTTTDSDVCN